MLFFHNTKITMIQIVQSLFSIHRELIHSKMIHFIQSVYNIFGSKLMIKTETIVNVEYVDAPAVAELNFF